MTKSTNTAICLPHFKCTCRIHQHFMVDSKIHHGFSKIINSVIASSPAWGPAYVLFLFFIRVSCVVEERLVMCTHVVAISVLEYFAGEEIWIHVDFSWNNRSLREHKLFVITRTSYCWSIHSRLANRLLRWINQRHLLFLLIKNILHFFNLTLKLLIFFFSIKELAFKCCLLLFFFG
jgi:hypothetical protein